MDEAIWLKFYPYVRRKTTYTWKLCLICTLGNFWIITHPCWTLLGTFGLFGALFGSFGPFWALLLWRAFLKSFSIFYVTLVGGVRKSLFTFVRHSWTLFGPFKAIFYYFGPFWALLGPFWALLLWRAFLKCFGIIVGVGVRKSLFIFVRPWVGPFF